MWELKIVCSSCAEETEVLEELDDVEREVCECGYSFVVVSVAEFSELRLPEGGEVVELKRRRGLPLAA